MQGGRSVKALAVSKKPKARETWAPQINLKMLPTAGLWTCNGRIQQEWFAPVGGIDLGKIVCNPGGYSASCWIPGEENGKYAMCMDVEDGKLETGAPIQATPCADRTQTLDPEAFDRQKWWLTSWP